MAEGHELVVPLELREGETAHPAHRFHRRLPGPLEAFGQGRQVPGLGRLIEAAHPDVDGVNLPAAQDRDDVVSHLLQPEPHFHRVRMVLGHLDGVLVPQEVRGVEHEDVEAVGLDPLAAVEQPPQGPDGAGDRHPQGGLQGVHRAHLVGHRADAADAAGDVRRFGEVAPL